MSYELIETNQRPQQSSLRDLCHTALRHKGKMLIFLVAVFVGVAVLTFCTDKVYRSEAKLLVRLGRESLTLDPTANTGPIAPVTRSRESEILTELEILKSHKIAEKVVDFIGPQAIISKSATENPADTDSKMPKALVKITQKLHDATGNLSKLLKWAGLQNQLTDRDKAVLTILKNSEITTKKDISNIISVNFEAKSPQFAQKVLQGFLDAYMEEHVAVHKTSGSYEFFTQQSDASREKLAQLEQKIQKLRQGTSMSSIDEEIKVTLNRVGTLENDIDRVESSLAASKAKVSSLKESLAKLPQNVVTTSTTGYPNVAADKMRERLYELQLKEQDLLSKYSESSRQVQEIHRQVTEARTLLDKEAPIREQTTTGLSNAWRDTEIALLTEQASLSSLAAESKELRSKLTEARQQAQNLSDTAAEMDRLKREMEILETNYLKYAENLEQARIDQALMDRKISNIGIVQPPTLPIEPVRPNKPLLLILGLLLGMFGAVVLAFGCEYLDHTIKTPQEAEDRLGLPVLTYIPKTFPNTISPLSRQNIFSKQNGKTAPAAKDRWDIPVTVKNQYDVLSEHILSRVRGSRRKQFVLAFTSAHRHEGTSGVAANVAASLSHAGKGRVLLVDANLKSPALHKIFQDPSLGQVDIFSRANGCGDAIRCSPVENLSILPAVHANGNGLELLKPDELGRILSRLKGQYRYIIMDLPAIDDSNMAVRLASSCDAVGLVVEAGKSRWQAVQATKERLLMSGANILGIVLNKRSFPVPGWLYKAV